MTGRIQAEIKQGRPFKQVQEEAFVNIERTADLLAQRFTDLLRRFDLTCTQYNVLRILRGAGETGLSCKEIGARMVTRDPDITRLLDRLEKRNLITRDRAALDRRHFAIRITREGLDTLADLDRPVHDTHAQNFQGISEARLNTLIDILEEIRSCL